MNAIEQYDANNTYFPIVVNNSNDLYGISFLSVNDSVYKTKIDWGDGFSSNVTNLPSQRTFTPNFSGKIKIYNNPKKITTINLNLGISNYDAVKTPAGKIKNIELTPAILDYFPNTELLCFNHYCYGNSDSNFQGKVIGEWAVKCGDKLKSLQLINCDYPLSNPTFDLGLIPSNSVLESLYLGSGFIGANCFVSVNGSLSSIPTTCKMVHLGGDKTSTTNSISGKIPKWIEEFSRIGRNTIDGSIADLSPNLRYLEVTGTNTINGVLPSFPNLTYISLEGSNAITGSLSGINLSTTFINIAGLNSVSGLIPNFSECTSFIVTGSNNLSGLVPALAKVTTFTVSGSNALTGLISFPNATKVNIYGNNTVSSLNLPKATTVITVGQNVISGDLTGQINPNATNIQIGGSNTISSISGTFNSATTFVITGLNALSGDILSKLPNATNLQIGGNNKIDKYTSRAFPSTMNTLAITGQAALTTAMVDKLLDDLNTHVISWVGAKTVIIKGNCEPPSPASLDARNNLVSNKKIILSTNL